MRRHPHDDHRDGGFTLVEVLVSIVIEAMIVAALGAAFIGILNSSSRVKTSLSQSADARIAAAYIVSDASNSSGPEISLTDTTSCPDSSPPVAGTATPVVRFDSSETSSAGVATPDIVIYYLVSGNLIRRECQNGSLTSDSVVASNVATVTAVCSPTADCSGNPTSVTVTITETADAGGNQYQYSLTGTFQKLIGGGAPPSAPSPIFLLGAGNCTTGASGLDIAGGSALRVYGAADVNSGDVAGGGGCKAMQIGTDAGNYLAGSTSIYAPSGGTGTCGKSGSSQCPTVTNYNPALSDPYASLPALSGVPVGACSGTNPAPTGNAYPPGIYPQVLSIPATATFSGTYIFCAGLSFTNGARVTGTNVLFYFKGGAMSEGGDSHVALSAATTGSYAGLVMWQPASDTTAVSISNGGQFALTGAIYAPGADVQFTGGSVTSMVTSIVSATISLSGGANVTIGTPSATPLSWSMPGGFQTSLPLGVAYSSPAFVGSGGDGSYTWSATNLPAGLSMAASTGVISGTPTAAVTKTVTVTLSDALGDTPDTTPTFSMTIDNLPTLTSAAPASGGQSATSLNVVLTGTHFISGAVASFSGTGITVNSTTFTNATHVTANISIAANAPTGAGSVTVTNPDTGAVTTAGIFTVNAAPTVTSSTSGGQGATALSVTITGSGFVTGAGLAATFSGTGITVSSTTFVSATSVKAIVTIAAGAVTGPRDVTVTNPDGGAATGTGAFTVDAAPTITSVAPPSAPKSTTLSVVIHGTGFVNGAIVTFTGSNLPTINTTTWNSSAQITVNVTLSNKAKTWNVIVTNPDGGSDTASAAFSST